jgi:hypothetical protein
MRALLLHPKSHDRRQLRRERARRQRRAIFAPDALAAADAVVATDTVEVSAVAAQTDMRGAAPATDAQARQVRAAGGPLDRASYTCGCGYVFLAAVTTTVQCPHCGDAQAW